MVPFIMVCDQCSAQWPNQMGLITNVSGSLRLSFKAPEDWEVKDVGAFKTLVLCPKCKPKVIDPPSV